MYREKRATMTIRRLDFFVLKAAMLDSGLQTPALATAAGISLNYTYAIKGGLVPAASVRSRIADVLRVPEASIWPCETDAVPDEGTNNDTEAARGRLRATR